MEKEEGPGPEPPPAAPPAGEPRRSRKFSRLSCLRRRRHLPQAGDDSDLSEGFESDSSRDSARASEGSDSGSDKSLEGAGTAFDAETDSEMNSQESRSDLEDMEGEEGTQSPGPEPPRARAEAPESLNGPGGPSEASIASSLQAMSTQMFQSKRCFRLAPTFSNLLLQPSEPCSPAGRGPCVNGDVDKPTDPGICPIRPLWSLPLPQPVLLASPLTVSEGGSSHDPLLPAPPPPCRCPPGPARAPGAWKSQHDQGAGWGDVPPPPGGVARLIVTL